MNTQTVTEKKGQDSKKEIIAQNAKAPLNGEKSTLLDKIEKFKPEAFKSANERIERMKQFEALSKRYEQLKEKDNELKTFHAGNDKTSAKIIFQNAQGFSFEVRNSNIIGRLTEEAQKELKILLDESENEVLTFEI